MKEWLHYVGIVYGTWFCVYVGGMERNEKVELDLY